MRKRVYRSYAIRVNDKVVKLNGNIDATSYRTIRKYYHMTKHKYRDENCKVEMVGVYEDGAIGTAIFSKTFSQETIEDKELLKTTDEIISEIKSLLELLDRKSEYHSGMISAFNKKQDLLLHKIECIKSLDTTKVALIDEKLRIINELEEVRHNRRFNKDEAKKLQLVYNKANIQEIIETFSQIKIPINIKDYKYIDGDLEEQIIKEIKYKSEKERVNIMGQVRHKYKKIVNDEARHTLICYNYAYHSNENKN